jgi:hypothetical protein
MASGPQAKEVSSERLDRASQVFFVTPRHCS